jgi:hypothetical protein
VSAGAYSCISQIRHTYVLPLTLVTVRTDYGRLFGPNTVTVVRTSSNTRPTNGLTLLFYLSRTEPCSAGTWSLKSTARSGI